jgi:hypothetical protein
VTVSDITPEAAGYAARYTLKKIGGDMADEHYGGKTPEFNVTSNGLGKGWIEKYWKDIEHLGYVVYKGKECPIPRYYWKWLKDHQPKVHERLIAKAVERSDEIPYESGKRIYQASQARDARTSALRRDYEDSGTASPLPADRSRPNRPLDR